MAAWHFGAAQDEDPLLDSIVQYYYVDGNDSIRSWKWEYQFNNSGLEIYHTIYNSWTGSRWNLFEEQQNIFNEKGDTLEKIEHHTLEHGLHYPYVKHEWEYDAHGNPEFGYKYYKNEAEESWIPIIKAEQKHSPEGKLIQLLYYNWSTDFKDWIPNQLYTYSYNTFGSETECLIEGWSFDSNRWETGQKNVKTYTPEGIIQSDYVYFWKPYEGIWEKWSGFWTEYDSVGRISKQLTSNLGSSQLAEYYYDQFGNSTIYVSNSPPWIGNYVPHYKFIKTYNTDNEIITVERYRKIDGVWSPEVKSENIFDETGKITETILYEGDPETLKWFISGRKHYFYHHGVAGNRIVNIEKVEIFPNPTSGIVNITGLTRPAEVKVYSLQGQLLKSKYHIINKVDISDLPAGAYLLEITAREEARKMTIIKR
jgi:hypothetical protein